MSSPSGRRRTPVVDRARQDRSSRAVLQATRRPTPRVDTGVIEPLLSQSTDGQSARMLARHAGASYPAVLARLREFQDAGRVRRHGRQRTSRWRVVTDEDRIATRVAELERSRRFASPAGPEEPSALGEPVPGAVAST